METNVKRREWVKTAAIIFLSLLLVATLIVDSVSNRFLPEVATQMVTSGAINAKIRGSGTVSANETYDVTISQTRKIASVMVRQGQTVNAGDVLFVLEAQESEELKAAQEQLESMELAYEKSLIEAGNAASSENRQIEKAREDYNEALTIYHQYSTMDASQIERAKAQAEQQLRAMERERGDLMDLKADLEAEKAEASEGLAELEQEVKDAEAMMVALQTLRRDEYSYDQYPREYYSLMLEFAEFLVGRYQPGQDVKQVAASLADDQARFETDVLRDIDWVGQYGTAQDMANVGFATLSTAYTTIAADRKALTDLGVADWQIDSLDENAVTGEYNQAVSRLESAEATLDQYDLMIEQYEASIDALDDSIADQQEVVNDLTSAVSAAANVKAAKEVLEDLLFQQSLGDSSYLDVQAAKEAIEEQKKEVERLTANADEAEVTAKVGGVIGAIHVTAGNTIGAESPLCTIEVVDRGYTVKIPVTNEQAKKVTIGDTADLVNYWGGDIEVRLESITSDPANPGQGRLLVFRLTGEVEPGVNLNLSIGQRSANFDCLIPNSALRTDSNGTFVLVMVAKSSPLGNRFTAVRADVQVLAADDTTTAVSGLSGGDFVITTSTQPIEAGQQVRQAEQ